MERDRIQGNRGTMKFATRLRRTITLRIAPRMPARPWTRTRKHGSKGRCVTNYTTGHPIQRSSGLAASNTGWRAPRPVMNDAAMESRLPIRSGHLHVTLAFRLCLGYPVMHSVCALWIEVKEVADESRVDVNKLAVTILVLA